MTATLGSRVIGYTALVVLGMSGLTGCGSGEVTVTGRLVTTEVYSDALYANAGISPPECGGWRSVQVKDGSGKILRVAKTTRSTGTADDSDNGIHTLKCLYRYEAKVPEADVYTVGFPKLTDMATGAVEKTLNRRGDTLKVPTMEAMLKPFGT